MSDLQLLRLMADPSLSWVEWLLALSTGALTAFALKVVFPSFRRTRLQEGAMIYLAIYLFLVLSSLVLVRPTRENYTYQLELFWSYKRLFLQGNRFYLWEDLLNVIFFVPAGFLIKQELVPDTLKIR